MLRTLVLPRSEEWLGAQHFSVGPAIYDSGAGAHMAPTEWNERVALATAWHAAVDGKGPTLTCVEMEHPTTNERFVFNAYTSRSWASSGGRVHDPHAALIWDGGVAVSQNHSSVYHCGTYGPTFGDGHSLCVIPEGGPHYVGVPSQAAYPGFRPSPTFPEDCHVYLTLVRLVSYNVCGKPAPTPARSLPFMLDGDGPTTIAKRAFRREASVTVLVASPAGAGKSTLCNWMASVISGVLENAFMSSANTVTGQCTTAMQRRPMFEQFAYGTALDGCGKELYVVDGKGYTNTLALSMMLSGRQRNGEAFDDKKPANLVEIAARLCDPDLMVMSVILPIRASVVVDPTNAVNRQNLDDVQRITQMCEHFVPDETAGHPGYQIQVIPVITCLDQLSWFDGMDARCLGEESEAMTRLIAACNDVGIDTRNAVFLGWLQESPRRGFYAMEDPRVKAVWTLLCRSVRSAALTKQQMRQIGWI